MYNLIAFILCLLLEVILKWSPIVGQVGREIKLWRRMQLRCLGRLRGQEQ